MFALQIKVHVLTFYLWEAPKPLHLHVVVAHSLSNVARQFFAALQGKVNTVLVVELARSEVPSDVVRRQVTLPHYIIHPLYAVVRIGEPLQYGAEDDRRSQSESTKRSV